MAYHVTAILWTLIFVLLNLIHSQSLPYNPTRVLIPQFSSKNENLAYAFLAGPESNAPQLVSLDISSHLSTSNLSFQTISPSLPFFTNEGNAFLPSISPAGEISVFSGSCSTSSSSQLWKFTPQNTSPIGNGTWAQETIFTAKDVTSMSFLGANFLSAGLSFSPVVEANASLENLYIFGGMCPSSSTTSSTWQSAASYSNSMLRLDPSTQTIYTLDIANSRGPPIAEAGFTITALTPTYSNTSGISTQQQNFVLIGGHTQTAFINTSQVAIWSLPEEAWSFVAVDSPGSSSGNTELAIKSTVTSIDSRSGHTAVLTEDGSSIIIFGGWVGDVTQAADPQLAVMSLGAGFGGTGDWRWSIPSSQPSGSGIYGHGAIMLAGNVMMIIGGYNISTSGNTKRDVPSTQTMFLNVTSMSWISSYTNPSYEAAKASPPAKSTSKKVGLGVGLGIGLVALLVLLAVLAYYIFRLRRRKNMREKSLQDLSIGAANTYPPNAEMGQRNGGFPWSNGRWNSNAVEGALWDSDSAVVGYENLHGAEIGLEDSSSVPRPPRQIARKPLHSRNAARGMYQPTSTFDFSPSGNSLGTAGPIHPIYEADEEDHPHSEVGIAISSPPGTADSQHHSDPFRGSPSPNPLRRDDRSTHSSAESSARSREREIQEWVSDWAAADILLNSQARQHSNAGRLSPTRRAQLIAASNVSSVSGEEDSDRTASTLSERSIAISAMSVSRSGSGSQSRSRTNSLRGFITGMNPFANTMLSTTVGGSSHSPLFDGPARATGTSSSSKSFNTAHTSFVVLQSEGESLLPRPTDDLHSGEHSPTRPPVDLMGSPSKSKHSSFGKRNSQGWLGSLRKVFTGDIENDSDNAAMDDVAFGSRDHGYMRTDMQPRRTASAGATLWRRKQGKGDWGDSEDLSPGLRERNRHSSTGNPPSRLSGFSVGDDDDDDEWDIERAVENRVVQVMFTVPKEKLRVVNHDVDEDKSEGGSLRSRKGSGKRNLRDLVARPLIPEIPGPSESVEEKKAQPLEREVDIKEDLQEMELEKEQQRESSPERRVKGRVLEMVEKMERAESCSPERER